MNRNYSFTYHKILLLIFVLSYGDFCLSSDNNSTSTEVQESLKILRTLEFAGVTWNVKSGGPYGPGPNLWTDDPQNVWVDDQGRLHMKIVKISNKWYCSEVYTTQFSSYGEHRFLVEGYIDRMDKYIVLGLFLYASDDAEIDIEYSKWGGGSSYRNVGGYTIQPYYIDGNNHQFESPLEDPQSTHYFDWQPGYVIFASLQGHHQGPPPSPRYYIEQWVYTGSYIPDKTKNLRTHINFWLMSGNAPEDLSVLEVIISDVLQPLNTDIDEKNLNTKLPGSSIIHQNYPNPFNSETIIRYQLIKKSRVTLKLLDNSGRIIQTLVNKEQTSGSYNVHLSGQSLSSGIYYYQLNTDYGAETGKMLLIK